VPAWQELLRQQCSHTPSQEVGKIIPVLCWPGAPAVLLLLLSCCRVGRVGRADHMGLAISLVSGVPEKVWFCTIKGYKPWLEPDAKNTKTQEQGGHTIW